GMLRMLERLQREVRAVPLRVIDAAERLIERDLCELLAALEEFDSEVAAAGYEQIAAGVVRRLRIGSERVASKDRRRTARLRIHLDHRGEVAAVVTGD